MFGKHIIDVEHVTSTKILGNDCSPLQWRFTTINNASPKKVGDLKSNNNRVRKLMSNATCLINESIADADCKNSHIRSMNRLLPALEFLRKKNDIIDEEVENFQLEFDLFFFQDWINFWGQKPCPIVFTHIKMGICHSFCISGETCVRISIKVGKI